MQPLQPRRLILLGRCQEGRAIDRNCMIIELVHLKVRKHCLLTSTVMFNQPYAHPQEAVPPPLSATRCWLCQAPGVSRGEGYVMIVHWLGGGYRGVKGRDCVPIGPAVNWGHKVLCFALGLSLHTLRRCFTYCSAVSSNGRKPPTEPSSTSMCSTPASDEFPVEMSLARQTRSPLMQQ